MTKTLVVDVETNGLVGYTRLWCVVTYCIETKEWKVFDYADGPSYLDALRSYLSDATQFIGHNFLSFDRHVLARFLGMELIRTNRVLDTLVLSRLYNSGRLGGHSLERWGAYFKLAKIPFDAWEYYDKRIIVRCKRDVEITLRLFEHLKAEGKHVSQFARTLEHHFSDVLEEIKTQGFPLDIEGVEKEIMVVSAQCSEMLAKIQKEFPPKALDKGCVTPRRRAGDGKMRANNKGFKTIGPEAQTMVWGPFHLVEWQEFNVGSPKQVVERMEAAGWKPVEFTKPSDRHPEGQPKVSPANLDTLPDDAPASTKLISAYLKADTRLGLLKNWAENYNPKTGRVHGSIIGIGTITHRGSHNNPNMGNITKGPHRAYWGFLGGDRRIAGVDAKGIQLRILAHLTLGFTDDDTFLRQVLDGDPHLEFTLPLVASLYPEAVAYTNDEEKKKAKDKTKRFIYAWLLGAGAAKVGSIFGLDARAGKIISDAFVAKFPGLKRLKAYLSMCAQKGWFPNPDGRFIPIKSDHYSLSVALQGIEQAVMKMAGVMWQRERNVKGWDAWLIAWVHDEYQIEGHKDCIKEAGEYMSWCIAEAGRILKLRCPMEGDAPTIGMNWNETH